MSDNAPSRERCGWPVQLPDSSTVVNCGLPACHDGPWCALLDGDGHARATAPRFGVRLPHRAG